MGGRRVIGWAARDASGHLSPYSFTLRKTSPEDVVLQVLYCGIDHTDLHQIMSEITVENCACELNTRLASNLKPIGNR
ncbi:hypothetical protein SLA2020_410360 [Shorea laevis]